MSETPFDPLKDATQQEPLTDYEVKLVTRLLGDPFRFPLEFKAWLKGWVVDEFPFLGSKAGSGTGVTTRPPSYGTSFPASPLDTWEHILVDSLTAPSYQWRFRYNASSTSIYKWEFIGGSEAWAQAGIGVGEATIASSTWQDLATVGPRVLNLPAGVYDVMGVAQLSCPGAALVQMDIWDGANVGSGFAIAYTTVTGNYATIPVHARITLPTAGHDIRMRYWSSITNTSFFNRTMRVTPVRVS